MTDQVEPVDHTAFHRHMEYLDSLPPGEDLDLVLESEEAEEAEDAPAPEEPAVKGDIGPPAEIEVICDATNNSPEDVRQNRVNVTIQTKLAPEEQMEPEQDNGPGLDTAPASPSKEGEEEDTRKLRKSIPDFVPRPEHSSRPVLGVDLAEDTREILGESEITTQTPEDIEQWMGDLIIRFTTMSEECQFCLKELDIMDSEE